MTFGIVPVCLNSGAFATVRLAIEKDTGAKFAIKIIDKHKFETSNSSGHSLMDEVNILKKINHPNIIGIQDVFETATKMYLVLELYGFLRESERERERDVDADHVNVSCGMDALVDTHASWRCECVGGVVCSVTGGELFDRIVSKRRITEEEARPLFMQMLDATDYLHSTGIAHRDLKVWKCARARVSLSLLAATPIGAVLMRGGECSQRTFS